MKAYHERSGIELISVVLQFVLNVFSHDLEAQEIARRNGVFDLKIVVNALDINDFLTKATHDPATATAAAAVDSFPNLSSESPKEAAQVLVLTSQTNKRAIAIATVIETSLILLVGLMVGVVKQEKNISLSIVLPALLIVFLLKAVAWKQSN